MKSFIQFSEDLSPLWGIALEQERIQYPFFSFAWHTHWAEHFGNDEHLSVFADPDAHVIIPLSIKDDVAHFTGGEEIADYLDAIGPDEKKALAWKTILPTLNAQGATTLVLRNVPEGSGTLAYFRSVPNAVISEEDVTPTITLPSSFDIYLESLDRKNRHELKRKMRKFEAEHQLLTFHPRNGSAIDMNFLIQLMKNDDDKRTFLTADMTEFFSDLPNVCNGSLWQFVLTQENRIVACTVAFHADDTLLLYNSGFDPRYPGAGWYIKVKTIAWAIEQGLTTYNLLQGNERYKYDLGAKDTNVYRIKLPLQ